MSLYKYICHYTNIAHTSYETYKLHAANPIRTVPNRGERPNTSAKINKSRLEIYRFRFVYFESPPAASVFARIRPPLLPPTPRRPGTTPT